jgi:hypothetical protein
MRLPLAKRDTTRHHILLCLLWIFLLPVVFSVAWLCSCGESFFSVTRRLAAEVLVADGWIGRDGIRAAAEEFKLGGYEFIVVSGDMTEERRKQSDDDLTAEQELVGLGIPKDRIITAPNPQVSRQRTFVSVVAAWKALETRGVRPKVLNLFTLGPHARRSRLVYAKVFGPATQVGVIAFVPPEYEVKPWWLSKRRTLCLLKEFVGYPFEILLNSARSSNSPNGGFR